MKVLYLLLLAIILAVFLGGCVSEPKDGFNSQRIGNRIVYTTDAGANVEILKKDCGRLGGWFNECGSTGTAAAVCAFPASSSMWRVAAAAAGALNLRKIIPAFPTCRK